MRFTVLVAALFIAASCGSAKTYEMRGQILGCQPRQDGNSRQARGHRGPHARHDDAMEGADGEHARQPRARRSHYERNRSRQQSGGRHKNHEARHCETRRAGTGGTREAGREVSDAGRRSAQSGRLSTRKDASAISTRFAASRPIAVTFIYTKCPIPTFCPAMDRQFAEAQALIKEKGLDDKAALLSVSFDPKNDTPPVLKTHAQKLGSDPRVWTFVTGEREAIDRFATNMLVTLVRGEAANPDEIGHTLRTTIVGRDGRIVKSYSGADWTPHRTRRRARTPAVERTPLHLTPAERRLVERLRTPLAVQRYLNALPYNTEPPPGRATLRSFRGVVRHHTAHCLEAALVCRDGARAAWISAARHQLRIDRRAGSRDLRLPAPKGV